MNESPESQSPSKAPPQTAYRALLLATSTLVAAGVFLLLPVQIYLGNLLEYSIPTGPTTAIMSGWALVAFCVFAIPGMLVPVRVRRWYCILLLAAAVAAYLQANYLVWNYGLLDGRELRWEQNRTRGFLDVIAWVCVFALAVGFRKRLLQHGVLIALCLLGIQAIAGALAFINREEPPSHHFHSVSSAELVTFSPKRNIVLLLLDEFQSNTFADLLEKEPGIREKLGGFVYHPDAVAGFAKTMGSIPNILTGRFYDNQRPIAEFLEEAYAQSVLPSLKTAGYRVELYPITKKLLHLDASLASNITPRASASMFGPEAAGLIDTSIFRSVPHDVKKWVVGDGTWIATRSREWALQRTRATGVASARNGGELIGETRFRDLDFHRALQLAKVSEDEAPRFKFIHLQGPHEPFLYDADLTPRRLPHGAAGYVRQARGALRILEETLATIERLGIGDRTDILVVSDHGAGEYGILPPGGSQGSVPQVVRSSGLPLVMLKRAGARGPFAVSDRPVTLADVAPTIASLAGVSGSGEGRSLIGEAAGPRVRKYFHYDFDGWDRRYLPPLVEYEVTGHSWNSESWRATGRVLSPIAGDPARMAPSGVLAQSNSFAVGLGKGKPGLSILEEGWADAEPNEVWTNGAVASMRVPVDPASGASRLSFILRPFVVSGRVESQLVEVVVDGRVMAHWTVEQPGAFGLFIPPSASSDGELAVEFRLPNAISPKEILPGSTDPRRLGVAVNEVKYAPIPDFPASGVFDFRDGGNARAYQLWGWSNPDPDGTWTTGRTAGILIPGGPKGSWRRISATVQPYLHRGRLDAQWVVVSGGEGGEVSWSVTQTGGFTAQVDLNGEPWTIIELTLPDAVAPIDHPTAPSPDTRRLGLKFEKLVIGRSVSR